MTTKNKKNKTMVFLEGLAGGSLTFGDYLRAIREGEEMSQVAFAKLLGISRAHLCDIEKGRKMVGPARAWAWGKKLGYSPAHFVELALQDMIEKEGLKNCIVRLDVA